jgi:formate-dependent nitrite reductase membrane component NrfD
VTATESGVARGRNGRNGRGRRRGEQAMVPEADFTSYYGRPVVKAAPWTTDIPSYVFLGGLAAGSSLLGAGADLTGRDSLRRPARIAALGAISASMVALIHDLGRPSRFHHMLRVAKPTSPMSVGSWILTAYGPLAGLAGAAEILGAVPGERSLPVPLRAVQLSARPAGLLAGAVAPAVATYTAVLLSDTALPSWHEAWRELPFVFAGSAAAAAGGLGLIGADVDDAGPARRMAVGGALLDLAAGEAMSRSMGRAAEPLHQGRAGWLMKAAKALTAAGAAGAVAGRRSRLASAVSGAALLAGSACTRFGIFYAGQASAHDPKYTIVPQRERIGQATFEQ